MPLRDACILPTFFRYCKVYSCKEKHKLECTAWYHKIPKSTPLLLGYVRTSVMLSCNCARYQVMLWQHCISHKSRTPFYLGWCISIFGKYMTSLLAGSEVNNGVTINFMMFVCRYHTSVCHACFWPTSKLLKAGSIMRMKPRKRQLANRKGIEQAHALWQDD